MTSRLSILLLYMLAATVSPAWSADTVWTAVIARGFPDDVFTWHLKADGSYSEDGRSATSATPVQPTLSGRWTVSGRHMVLRQAGINYVFDGVVAGEMYQGVLYLDGKAFARFCAIKGDKPPPDCDISA